MKIRLAIAIAALAATPTFAQYEGGGGDGEIVVTAMKRVEVRIPVVEKRPVVGLRRQADSAVRRIEIVSDSREEDLRKRELQAMLFAAIDRAKGEGLNLVTGQYKVVEVTRANWKTLFPALAAADEAEDEEDEDDDDDDEDNKPKPVFEDDGETATLRLLVKTPLTGTIADAQSKIASFVKRVPVTGRSQMTQTGQLSLTIVRPEQYRDDIYKRVSEASKHAASFFGTDYGIDITGLDKDIAWEQVSETEVFLYIPYNFAIKR